MIGRAQSRPLASASGVFFRCLRNHDLDIQWCYGAVKRLRRGSGNGADRYRFREPPLLVWEKECAEDYFGPNL